VIKSACVNAALANAAPACVNAALANAAFTHAGLTTRLNGKLVKMYFCVKLAQYFVCEEDRKLASYCKHEILVSKLGKLFLQTSRFVSGRQNR